MIFYSTERPSPSISLSALFLSSPWNTWHSLSQIQYLPKNTNWEIESDSDLSDEITLFTAPLPNETGLGDRLIKDEDGYFYSTDHLNPTWQLEPKNYSLWEMAKRLVQVQGVESLWSALGSETLIYYSSFWIEKSLEVIISPYNPWNRIGISLIRSFILAPLDIIQVRLYVQSSLQYYQSYTSTFNCLKSLFSKVSIFSLYTSSRVLASVLETGVSSLLYLGMTTMVKRYNLGILGILVLSAINAGIMSPIETIRKRIQVFGWPQEPELKTIVQVPKIPWIGITRTFYRMWNEEGASSFYRGFKRKWIMSFLGIYEST